MATQSQKAPRILVIDDDPGLAEVIQLLLSREGYAAERAGTLKAGLQKIGAAEVDLVITDLKLPDGTGLDAIRVIRERHPRVPIIMITSYSSMESAIAALRAGAVDYIIKPFDNEEFLHAIERALAERRMQRENAALKRSLRNAYSARRIIGESAGMRRVGDLVRKVAPSDASVLVAGETGTGKELVALALHYASPRADGPFVPVDCGAIPRDQIEAELFGRDKSEGLVREADGGTLFLDEISELAPALQAKLLRVLQERTVRRAVPIDVRFVAASQRDLGALVERGLFRQDLYYRLNVITIPVPPLRERGADILLLANHFAGQQTRKLGKRIDG